jgi:hypothetical protein
LALLWIWVGLASAFGQTPAQLNLGLQGTYQVEPRAACIWDTSNTCVNWGTLNSALHTYVLLNSVIPAPGTAPALGGVQAATAPATQFMTGISTAGLPTFGVQDVLHTQTNTFVQPQILNLNAGAAPAFLGSGTAWQIVGADTTPIRYEIQSFGQVGYLATMRYDGTNGARTAVTTGEPLGGMQSWGYDGSAPGVTSVIRGAAAQPWTTSAHGSYVDIYATPLNSTAGGSSGPVRVNPSGGLSVGSPTGNAGGQITGDMGAGTVNVATGFYVNGAAIPTTVPPQGIWIGRQIKTATGTYTPDAGTNFVNVQCVGGGGGGAGAGAATAGGAASGGPGGGGEYVMKRITSAFSGVTVTIGAAGAAGLSAANGGAGGNTTFGALLTAAGGGGGVAGVAATAPPGGDGAPGAGGSGNTGDLEIPGSTSGYSLASVAGVVWVAPGGNSYWGFGAPSSYSTGTLAGNIPLAGSHGGGGGGAGVAQSSAATSGGAGTAGMCIIDEYQ